MALSGDITSFIENAVAEHNGDGLFRTPLVGFSAAADPLFKELKEIVGPHHLLPVEILPEAQTVISFFVPFAEQVVEANRKGGDKVAEEWAKAYICLNRLLNALSLELTGMLWERGFAAEMIRATHTYDPQTLLASWSHRSAAFIAGLGRFGRNRLIITAKGCAGRFGSVITAAGIEPDRRPLKEPCLYYNGGSCGHCFKNCPIQALGKDGSFARHRCNERLLTVDAGFAYLDTCDVCGKCAVGPCAFIK